MLHITAPSRNSKSPVLRLKMLYPVMSEAVTSGVNCTLPNVRPELFERALASVVLPTPGMSSIITCPPASRAQRSRTVSRRLPKSTPDNSSSIPPARSTQSILFRRGISFIAVISVFLNVISSRSSMLRMCSCLSLRRTAQMRERKLSSNRKAASSRLFSHFRIPRRDISRHTSRRCLWQS